MSLHKNYRYGCTCDSLGKFGGRLCAVCLGAEDREFVSAREIPDTVPRDRKVPRYYKTEERIKKESETSGFALVGETDDKAILVLTVDGHEGEVLMDRVTWEQIASNMAWR
jgi:hypothetical protein